MNVIDVLNIFYREDVISDFLKSCFENSPTFLQQFLNCAKVDLPTDTKFTTLNRLGLGKSIGTPDMIIVARYTLENHIVIIENKLGAGEGFEQTQRYESEAAQALIQKRLQLDDAHLHFHFVYLTLDTTVTPGSSSFTHVTYDAFLKGEWPLNDPTLNMIFTDFKEKIYQFYEPLKQPAKTLASNLQLDSTQKKICWQALLFEHFKDTDQFIFDWGAVGGLGRNNFLFLLTKPHWSAEKSFKETGLAGTFYIHMDTYINLLSKKNEGISEIGIRYETNPYEPHKQIAGLVGYDEFRAKKNVFAELLFHRISSQIAGVKKRNSKLLILTVPVDTSDLSSSITDYKNKILLIEKAIDATLNDLKSY